jgi:phosphate transport system permease protein
MTDPAPILAQAHEKRLRQRHRAERRFKLYGQIAISLAIGFLVILLVSIGTKASSAFTRHMLVISLDRPDLERQIPLSVTDVNLAVREELQNLFPDAASDFSARLDLYSLTTRLAVLPLTRKLQATPELANLPITAHIALSDDVDLYLKTEIRQHRTEQVGDAGRLAIIEGDLYRLTAAGPDGFTVFEDQSKARAQDISDTLISFSGSWFELDEVSGAALVLRHLAGPVPPLGEQAKSPIKATLLTTPSTSRKVSTRQIAMALLLKDQGHIERRFNRSLFTNADSTYPELAGVAAAIAGSFFTMIITALFAIPVGILAAIYLEEFARKSILTSVIEVNINNLAAVPSIIFGLLGAAVFLNTLGLPRSIPLVGGLVLGLLVLPTIIIASRAALRSVPPSVRDAALGIGASRTQAVFHHVLPLAAPGILTGAIIAMARALGETAPLLLIGMVAFISEVPKSPNDEATVLPVLIYKWFSGAERAWEPMTSAVIIILLVVLVSMNLVAVLLRRRFERRW